MSVVVKAKAEIPVTTEKIVSSFRLPIILLNKATTREKTAPPASPKLMNDPICIRLNPKEFR